jgi:hypothetical protein
MSKNAARKLLTKLKQAQQIQNKREKAAVKIQSAVRMYQAKQEIKKLRQERMFNNAIAEVNAY